MSLLALFIVQNFKTILTAAPELRMVNLLQKSIFGEKSLILSSSIYWTISLCQISKFFYNRPRVMRTRVPFVDPKWINFPKRKFFRKPGDKPSSYHSSLSTFQESKSDISLFMKYWRLKNTEISLICQIFHRRAVFTENQRIIRNVVLYQFQTKLMIWFF